MKLQQLEYVIAIAQEGSITRAAKRLFQAQPNISIALKELEETIGIQIFNRTPNGMTLTTEGEEFLARAKGIVEDVRTLEKDFKETSNHSSIIIVEASRTDFTATALSRVMNEFPINDDSMTMHISEKAMPQVLEDIANGKCDIGVVRIPVSYSDMLLERIQTKDMVNITVKEYTLKLLMRADHPLAKYDDVPFEELRDYTEVIYSDGEPDLVRRASINQNFEPGVGGKKMFIHDKGNQLSCIIALKDAYMWTSPLPDWLLARMGLVTRECSFAINLNRDLIIYRKSAENNPLVKECVASLIKMADIYSSKNLAGFSAMQKKAE